MDTNSKSKTRIKWGPNLRTSSIFGLPQLTKVSAAKLAASALSRMAVLVLLLILTSNVARGQMNDSMILVNFWWSRSVLGSWNSIVGTKKWSDCDTPVRSSKDEGWVGTKIRCVAYTHVHVYPGRRLVLYSTGPLFSKEPDNRF